MQGSGTPKSNFSHHIASAKLLRSNSKKFSFKIFCPSPKILLPSRCGWLKKMGKNPFKRWTKRFCRIENKKFFYYRNQKELNPLGCLDFDLVFVHFEDVMKDRKIVQF